MRGVRPGESTPVEIPASEVVGLRIDWVRSSLMLGRLCTIYQSVQMRWEDVKRLTQADVDRQAREARTVTKRTQVTEWAAELRRQSPEGPPAGTTREKLERDVRKKSGGKLEMISLATLDRARKKRMYRAERERASKPARPTR